MKKGTDDPEDLELWRRVARTVKAYETPRQKKAEAAPRKNKPKGSFKPVRVAVSLLPMATSALQPARPSTGLDGGTARRLKRGQLPIEGRLDLHGMSQDRAFAALVRFIAGARARGFRTILVITGKGARGGGILRRQVPLWLSSGDLARDVIGVEVARPDDGGDGALYVRLRRPEV